MRRARCENCGAKLPANAKFSEWYPQYQKVNARIPRTNDKAGQSAQVHQLWSKLNVKYKVGLRLQSYNTTAELVRLCQRLQQDFTRIDEVHPRKEANKDGKDNKDKDKSKNKDKSSSKPNTSTAPITGSKPWNDRPDKYKNLPKMTKELREQLDAEGRCRRCREKGHGPNDQSCPLIEYEKLPPGPRPNASGTTTTEAADSENA